jgi:hypothetical protein
VPGPGDLHDLAEAVLDAAVAAIDSVADSDPTLEGAPERQFVSPGIPVADFVGRDCCSQIAVWATPSVEADTTPGGLNTGRRSSLGWINQAGISVAVSRCIPTGESSSVGIFNPPSAASLTESSRQHNADGWALWNGMHHAAAAGRILEICDGVTVEGITAAIPAGGCAGWLLTLRAALGGYQEDLGS